MHTDLSSTYVTCEIFKFSWMYECMFFSTFHRAFWYYVELLDLAFLIITYELPLFIIRVDSWTSKSKLFRVETFDMLNMVKMSRVRGWLACSFKSLDKTTQEGSMCYKQCLGDFQLIWPIHRLANFLKQILSRQNMFGRLPTHLTHSPFS